MQPNDITLTVDETNDGSTTADVDHIYTKFDLFNTRSVYHHSAHEPDMRDMLSFYRTPAKASGNSRGTQKSAFKFTKDWTVVGRDGSNIVLPGYLEVNASIPLGVTDAQVMVQRQKAIALLDLDLIVNALMADLSI